MVVKEGFKYFANGISSFPITDMSSGILKLNFFAALYTPTACRSQRVTIAVKDIFVEINFFTAL